MTGLDTREAVGQRGAAVDPRTTEEHGRVRAFVQSFKQ